MYIHTRRTTPHTPIYMCIYSCVHIHNVYIYVYIYVVYTHTHSHTHTHTHTHTNTHTHTHTHADSVMHVGLQYGKTALEVVED